MTFMIRVIWGICISRLTTCVTTCVHATRVALCSAVRFVRVCVRVRVSSLVHC